MPQLSPGVLAEPGSCSAETRSCLCRALCEHTLLLSQGQLWGGQLCHPCCSSRRSCRDSLVPYSHVWSGFFVSLVTSKSRTHFNSLKMPGLGVMAAALATLQLLPKTLLPIRKEKQKCVIYEELQWGGFCLQVKNDECVAFLLAA